MGFYKQENQMPSSGAREIYWGPEWHFSSLGNYWDGKEASSKLVLTQAHQVRLSLSSGVSPNRLLHFPSLILPGPHPVEGFDIANVTATTITVQWALHRLKHATVSKVRLSIRQPDDAEDRAVELNNTATKYTFWWAKSRALAVNDTGEIVVNK